MTTKNLKPGKNDNVLIEHDFKAICKILNEYLSRAWKILDYKFLKKVLENEFKEKIKIEILDNFTMLIKFNKYIFITYFSTKTYSVFEFDIKYEIKFYDYIKNDLTHKKTNFYNYEKYTLFEYNIIDKQHFLRDKLNNKIYFLRMTVNL